jgi:dTDP-4-dehydrorhamnose reductase
VDKLTAAMWELAANDYKGILHIGGSQKVSRYQMGQVICEVLNLPERLLIPKETSEFQFFAPRAKDCSLNISRAKSVLKTELVSFAEGVSLSFRQILFKNKYFQI